jgi:MoaD family protein
VEVNFYATLRTIAGGKKVELDVPAGATVRQLLAEAEHRFPALTPLLWQSDGSLSDYIKVFVDGREMRHLQGLETLIPAGVPVDIFPPAAGG